MGTVVEIALAAPWFALAAATVVLSAVARWVSDGFGRRGRSHAAESMAWRGTAAGSGWRPDPFRRHTYRFHDGRGWTSLVITDGRAQEDRLDPAGS